MKSTREALQSVVARLAEAIDQLPTDPPEVPERVEVWPNDDTHLQGEFWEDKEGDRFRFSDGRWEMWSPRIRDWVPAGGSPDSSWAPYTRTTDPSLPRRFDSISDIPEDVERAVGKYLGKYPCELARSPLPGTGWFIRIIRPYARHQWGEYMDLDEYDLTDIEEVIGHE